MPRRDDGFVGVDRWLEDVPAMPSVRRHEATTKYVCQTCDWHGFEALQHHRETHHRHVIVLRDAPQWGPIQFGCCVPPDEPKPRVPAFETEGVKS